MTPEQIRSKLDLKHIEHAAAYAAAKLADCDVAHVKLTPNDGTVYPIIVVRTSIFLGVERGGFDEPRDYTVCVAASFGNTYQWAGQGGMHEDYVASKWTSDGNMWTAVVVTAFLNAFSLALGTGVT